MWRSGAVSTFAGSGECGHTNTSNLFERPFGVYFDASAGGSVICGDMHSVRRIKTGE